MPNPCDHCTDYCFYDYCCESCGRRGYFVDYTVGLGLNGLVPAYMEKPVKAVVVPVISGLIVDFTD